MGNNKTPFKVLKSKSLGNFFENLTAVQMSGFISDPQNPAQTAKIALAGLKKSGEVFVSYGGLDFMDPDTKKGGLVYLVD